jgi:hypothetical protein
LMVWWFGGLGRREKWCTCTRSFVWRVAGVLAFIPMLATGLDPEDGDDSASFS